MAAEWAQPQWDRQDMDRDNQARGTINSMNNTGRWGMGNIEMGVDGSPSNMVRRKTDGGATFAFRSTPAAPPVDPLRRLPSDFGATGTKDSLK
ncbi:uncharacterized protein PADG_05370 [Paracoccidioides brasiliensis Pb18]|uniref:Uncharacterized protein n=1 Tax=Paracoccidioides brasiliensis (strain Pb18) TaxID=502780 RepID=C1GDN4_PARBD|nr:uncharacterized protein PADG_05370 [Paracoccidioides brasiliensis Pb18]EEH49291.2 hypothetical protein PADG_05370 [Paracoccidioides brasiliensis Pb18]